MTHWITYSEPSASRLAACLSDLGQQTLCEPVTQIQRLKLRQPMAKAAPDLMIALSQHAVAAYLDDHFSPNHRNALTLAIGPATASQLIERGGFSVQLPCEANSEGLLSMPEIKALGVDQTVWLLTGEGGRDTVSTWLAPRCDLQRFDFYRRAKRQPQWSAEINLQAIWVGSIHGLQHVDASVDALKIRRQRTMLVVASERVADYAHRLGWRQTMVCEAFDGQAVRRACAKITSKGPPCEG